MHQILLSRFYILQRGDKAEDMGAGDGLSQEGPTRSGSVTKPLAVQG